MQECLSANKGESKRAKQSALNSDKLPRKASYMSNRLSIHRPGNLPAFYQGTNDPQYDVPTTAYADNTTFRAPSLPLPSSIEEIEWGNIPPPIQ